VWDLNFHPDVALTFNIDAGISEVNLDLAELSLDEANVDFGIGDVQMQLPETGEFTVNIDGGIGLIVIEVPEGLAVRLQTDTGIVMRSLPNGYNHVNGIYTSSNYRDAENRVDIRLALGIGSVTLREISNH
jgi:predicted membrane protein